MYGLLDRAQRAATDISEALGVYAVQPPVPLAPMPRPMPPPGMAAPGMPPGAPQQAPQRQPISPLQMMPDFRSPPMAAALQGARGQESLQKPVGFARGGFAVFGDR